MKKLVSLVLALALVLLCVGAAMAQTKDSGKGGNATITVRNAAKGETYTVVKVFDATVTADGTGINYYGTVPSELANFFEADSAGNITLKRITDANGKNPGDEGYIDTFYSMTSDDFDDLGEWAADQAPVTSATSDGSALTFTGLTYGYYVVLTTQGAGVVTVDSTTPNATVNDKNTTTVDAFKETDKGSYSIGETITYTATFPTANYMGTGENAKIVTKYEISDTLPEFLTDVQITSVKVMAKDGTTELDDLTANYTADDFGSNKKIDIPWATEISGSNPKEYQSNYTNGAKIVITYTAELTSVTNINTPDTNTVTIKPYVYDTTEKPWDEEWHKDKEIKTYGAAIHKVDEQGNDLPGAQFTVKGLEVTGSAGEYTVVSYDANSTTESAVLDTNDKGYLYIVGLASDVTLTVTEYKAPDGYNKLTAPVTVTPQVMSTAIYKESGEIHYDAKGNIVSQSSSATSTVTVQKNLTDLDAEAVEIQNKKGTELPSTGGIGTTIFYILGGLLVVGAAVILVARRRVKE